MQPATFSPPPPFTFSEFTDELPERVYTREELLNYLHFNREKCRLLIAGLTDGAMNARWVNVSGTMNFSVLEILLYNMRHVQHHVAQLNLLLRQDINNAPRWVTQTDHELQADLA